MALQSVRKTKRPDDCPMVEELAMVRLKRVEQTIKACQDSVRTAREVIEEAKRITARTLQLRDRRLKRTG